MKKALLTLVFLAAWTLLAGCEKDEDSRCPQLVAFTIDCYEQVVGRSPPDYEVSRWRTDCDNNAHSDACINCAMEQSCQDYITNHEYVYNTLCIDVCP